MLVHGVIVSVLVAVGSVVIVPTQPGGHASNRGSAAQPEAAKPVNDRCPIQGEEVDPETPTRTWKGHVIGFCCPGCDKEWDAKPNAEKDAFLAKYVRIAAASPAVTLARQFQAAMTAADLDGMNKLFLGEGKATVLENGVDEGTWEEYRDGHLKAELKKATGYAWTTTSEAETSHGATTIVRQVGGFSLGSDAARRTFSAAITFVVVHDGGTPKVAHMHWSSRELGAPAK